MALLWKVEGKNADRVHVQPENGTDFQLEELYKLLGCELIEVLYLQDGTIMIIDEEGKLKDPCIVNVWATELMAAKGLLIPGDLIVGPALLCREEELL